MSNKRYPYWPFYGAIGFAICGVIMVAIKIGFRISFIFFLISIFLFALWIYFILRIDYGNRRKTKKDNKQGTTCICPICNHDNADNCVQQKCPCCINMKGNTVVGHSNNPLQ